MFELFGMIVVVLSIAVVTVGTLILLVISTINPHFMQRKAKNPSLVKADAHRAE
ncbi:MULTISPECIES: hypothetical protein [unclassified Rhodococcus (in: high G+C Gram-positive bacteria)]|jgi:hypothetical protein|uniref:hypothetical protein n=1 Tax=unclassified Rhodococcus (in: high G+C Gram-positive bacteria) TaxID=192944 RepID=UPI00146B31F8|nr:MULTISPECIES: hypothetical protein [unclassified Rhodococcus (in: high G+C Gram-positive bacteria)]MBF0662246.1 hypothetical protein [Rhodococcus sp. (in: high G+C Gram-positive bacteria)]NMD95496.1 hypothetical protein [Rhodococcus sp. BL-253-APC-6A1W]NME79491.1 hypothetical protein [Rhodococcus sp. 105337]